MEDRVYVIGPADSSIVKIGVTNNLERRLREIQTMSPLRLEVLWACVGSVALEAALHREFADIRMHGEWFDFGDDDPVTVIRGTIPDVEVVDGKASEARKRRASTSQSDKRGRYMPHYGPTTIFASDPKQRRVEGWPVLDYEVQYYREKDDRPEDEFRCWCGHQIGSHDSVRPHACGGSCNTGGMWSDCLCLGYDGPLPKNLANHDLPGHNWENWRTA